MRESEVTKLKPRSTICWLCGRRLYQHRVFVEIIIDEHPRILHKQCATKYESGSFEEDYDNLEDLL